MKIRETLRTALAFLVAPLTPAILLSIPKLAQGQSGEFWWGLKLAATIGYPVAIIFGIPIFSFSDHANGSHSTIA